MNKKQIDIFYDMACLYEYVGELKIGEQDIIEDIQKLYGCDEFNAIDVLYNEECYDNADDAFDALFGIDIERLNELADECGYQHVNS